MTIEQEIQQKFIKWLQVKKIDFTRIGNTAFRGRVTSPYTHAFDDPRPCHKYWPDITFCHKGNVYMVEFGVPGSHKNRKIQQEIRMRHWMINGGVLGKVCYSWEDCEELIAIVDNR